MPVEAERVLKQAALTCAMAYFEDDPKEGIAQPAALLQKFGINTNAKKANTMLAEILRACARVTQGMHILFQAKNWVYENCDTAIGAEALGLYVPPDSMSVHPELNITYFNLWVFVKSGRQN